MTETFSVTLQNHFRANHKEMRRVRGFLYVRSNTDVAIALSTVMYQIYIQLWTLWCDKYNTHVASV